MNCFQAREALLQDPGRLSREALAHLRECPHCDGVLHRQIRQEKRLREVLDVQPEPGFEARLRCAVANERVPAARTPWLTGIAAVAAVALLAGAWLLRGMLWSPDLARDMLAHIEDDPIHMLMPSETAHEDLQRVLAQLGGGLRAHFPGLLRVKFCLVDGRMAAHLVLARDGRRQVVFLVPEKTHAKPTQVAANGWNGRIRARDGWTVAVFAQAGEPADLVDEVTAYLEKADRDPV